MNIKRVFGKPRLLRVLTSLEAGEFKGLLKGFEAAWQEQRDECTDAGQARQRKPGAGQESTLQPKRNSRVRELHSIQKTTNQVISRVRVGVEHAIGGIKRFRIVAAAFRCWREGLVDEVMLAAIGQNNLRVLTCQPN